MASFFSSLVGGFANTAMQRRDIEQKREDDAKKSEISALGVAMDSGRLTDEGWNAAMSRIEELSDTKGKKGQESPLRSVLTKLRGQIPKDKQYQAQTLNQTVAAQNPRGSAGNYNAMARANAETRPVNTARGDTPPTTAPPNPRPHAFMTQAELQDAQINLDKRRTVAQAQAEADAKTAQYRAINQTAAGITDPETRRSFLHYMNALPPDIKQKVTFVKGVDPDTGHEIVKAIDDSGVVMSSFDAGLPAGSKPQKVTVRTPDGKISQAWERPGGLITDSNGKPLPNGTQLMASASYYPELHPPRLTGQPTAASRATDYNRTLTYFRQLEAQANTSLNQAKSQANTHYIQNAFGALDTSVDDAQAELALAQKASGYVQAHKQAVLDGTEDPQDVSDAAQDILNGIDVPMTAPKSPAKTNSAASKPKYKAGDKVMYKGQERTIQTVRPDGKLVFAP